MGLLTPDSNAQPGPAQLAARFWPRLAAFVVDAALLFMVASLLGQALYAPMMALNPWLPWMGVLLLFLYFALLDGPLGKGQTLGKSILRLRTVAIPDVAPEPLAFQHEDEDEGEPAASPAVDPATLTPPGWAAALRRAALKAFVISIVLNYSKLLLALPAELYPQLQLATSLLRVLAMAALIGELTTLFMHPLRLALHDVLAGTRVIRIPVAGQPSTDPPLDPIAESRARLARRVGVFVTFTGFILLSYGAVESEWLSTESQQARRIWSEAHNHLELGPYRLTNVSVPTLDRMRRVDQAIARQRAAAESAGQTVPSTDTLRAQLFFDDRAIIAFFDRRAGTLDAKELEDPALLAELDALRGTLFEAYVAGRIDPGPFPGRPPLADTLFECVLFESFSLLYYVHAKPGTAVRFSGPADPARGPLTYTFVDAKITTGSATTTPQPPAGTPLAQDTATTR